MSRPRARGYILVETMVALLVLALVLGATLDAVASSTRVARRVADTRAALLVARSTLEEVGTAIPLAPGTVDGVDHGFVWRVRVERPESAGLSRVSVAVGRPGAPPLATLATLKLAAAGPR